MEKKNELAKEERTIFIVLAIIILIAIGVLVTWYFTKDKEAEKDKEEIKKSTETVDKQKKKDTNNDTGSTYTFETKDNQTEEVVVLSANVVPQEEIQIVEVTTKEEGIGNVEPIESINYDQKIFYLIGEKINFANFSYDNEGTLTEIRDGKIMNVALYNETISEATMDAEGRYTISNDNIITFNKDGIYAIDIQNSDGVIHTVYVVVFAHDDFLLLVDSLKKEVNELEAMKYYDQTKYMEFINAYAEFSNLPLEQVTTDLKNAYIDIINKYNELCLTFNQELYKSDHSVSSNTTTNTNNVDNSTTEEAKEIEELKKTLQDLIAAIENAYSESEQPIPEEVQKVLAEAKALLGQNEVTIDMLNEVHGKIKVFNESINQEEKENTTESETKKSPQSSEEEIGDNSLSSKESESEPTPSETTPSEPTTNTLVEETNLE